jgi:cyclopropane fatty-acyl-phospholipid synthase-like methyltransferase
VRTLPNAPACERNRQPILDVLRQELAGRSRVLEIGSGTGQHAVFFAAELPQVAWQTSDRPENHQDIRAWLEHAGPDNVLPPLVLDVETFEPGGLSFDAVFSANTAHIMPVETVRRMFGLVGEVLEAGGVFCLYGPFNFEGGFSSDSNAAFDASLKQRNAGMGIRDIGELDEFAAAAGLVRVRLYAMPANNHLAVWRKGVSGTGIPVAL